VLRLAAAQWRVRGRRSAALLATIAVAVLSFTLLTGASETSSSRMRSARITIHHDSRHPSRLILPVVPSGFVIPSEGRQAAVAPSALRSE